MAGHGDIKLAQGGPMEKKARAPTRAGYRQVIALMRRGCGAEEILATLRMRPARLRQIVAGRPFRRTVELERLMIESALALRLGDKAGKAVSLLAMAAKSGKPYTAYKAAMAVINLANRPLPHPPQLTSGLDLQPGGQAAGRLGVGMSDLQGLVLDAFRDGRGMGALAARGDNA